MRSAQITPPSFITELQELHHGGERDAEIAVEAAGYGSLKEKQIEVIVNLVKGNDVFCRATDRLWQS